MLKTIFSSIALASLTVASLSAGAASARQCAQASFYGKGDGFHGRTAADGSRFNANALTTAHKSLPFGTRLRVINQASGKSVVVTVTDRGPYIAGRSLDLSYGAFKKIARPSQGIAQVCFAKI